MSQMQFVNIEEDILASSVRWQKNLFEKLIQDLERRRLNGEQTLKKIREIEGGLKKLCQAA